MYLITENALAIPAHPRFTSQGSGWVRVAPLVLIAQSAPYLHNGSIPTLESLLTAPAQRPREFPIGLTEQQFKFDTGLPGNRNTGHLFGVDLPPDEKRALIAFMRSLP